MDRFINDYELVDQDSFAVESDSLIGVEQFYAEDHTVPPAWASLLGVEALPKHTG